MDEKAKPIPPRKPQFTLGGLFVLTALAAFAAYFAREFGAGGLGMILGMWAGIVIGNALSLRNIWATILAILSALVGTAAGIALTLNAGGAFRWL